MAEGVYVAVFSAIAEFQKGARSLQRSLVTTSTHTPAPAMAIQAVLVPRDTDLKQTKSTEVDESKLEYNTKVVQEATHEAEVCMLTSTAYI